MITIFIYTVKQGDTLYSIGRQFGFTVNTLINTNGDTVTGNLAVGQAVIIPTPDTDKRQALINGYAYPFIEDSSLYGYSTVLSLISPFSYGITEQGTLISLDDKELILKAQNLGIKPLLLVTSLTESGVFSSERIGSVLTSFSEQLINSIVEKLQTADYFGVDIDFEYIPQNLASVYAEFITNLKAKISPLGYYVFVSLAPKTSQEQRGLLYEAHDYSALGEAADYLLIMTYEWGYTYGPPMAIAPINKVRQVIDFAVTQMPPEKILLGIPNYAYDWTLPYIQGSAARSLTNENAVITAQQKNAEIMFDDIAKTPYYNYTENGISHVVWFEDARSVKARCDLIKEYNLAGAGIWNIMAFYKPLETTVFSNFTKAL